MPKKGLVKSGTGGERSGDQNKSAGKVSGKNMFSGAPGGFEGFQSDDGTLCFCTQTALCYLRASGVLCLRDYTGFWRTSLEPKEIERARGRENSRY